MWLRGTGVGGNWGDVGEGYKLSVIIWIISGDLVYSMETIVSNGNLKFAESSHQNKILGLLYKVMD